MNPSFYKANEEKHLVSDQNTQNSQSSLQAYLPFIAPLKQLSVFHANNQTVDLGCGSGEFLEWLKAHGFEPIGVDIDTEALKICNKKGLHTSLGDANNYIAKLGSGSQMMVTALHLVEYIPFEKIYDLVQESLRALKPGGLLILETSNPENIGVEIRNFYLESNHQKPISSYLLSFLVEYVGFATVKTIRLRENKDLSCKNNLSMQDIFTDASPSYAVVAQKQTSDGVLNVLADVFERDDGLSHEQRLNRWNTRFEELEAQRGQLEVRVDQVKNRADLALGRADLALGRADLDIFKAEQAMAQLQAVYASNSWRITAPLRWVLHQVKLIHNNGFKNRIKDFIRKLFKYLVAFVKARPKLKQLSFFLVQKMGLQDFFRRMQSSFFFASAQSTFASSLAKKSKQNIKLTPRATVIYTDIKAAIENIKQK
jgi:O-antigen chain-terminating methyltransferase